MVIGIDYSGIAFSCSTNLMLSMSVVRTQLTFPVLPIFHRVCCNKMDWYLLGFVKSLFNGINSIRISNEHKNCEAVETDTVNVTSHENPHSNSFRPI